MRLLIFHGYLLEGTGSNVYNARLAEALAGLGHEVHLLCQERRPERLDFVGAAGDWDSGELRVRALPPAPGGRAAPPAMVAPTARATPTETPEPAAGNAPAARCTVYRPDIGGLLPVYVADRYEGVEARTFAQCSDEEVQRYIEANVAAVAEVVARVHPQAALANHLVMGPVILARALGGRVPYAVKVHGSALEYTVKPQPERFLGLAREGLQAAAGVLVGSDHTARSLWRALDDPALERRTRLGPPGVDVARFTPREPSAARAGVRALEARVRAQANQADQANRANQADRVDRLDAGARSDAGARQSAFARDASEAAQALAGLASEDDVLVGYVGKLIVSKGVDLLVAAWPLVLGEVPHACLAIVGFGSYREGLEGLVGALRQGDLDRARELALAGRSLEDPSAPARPLGHLLAFLDSLAGGERERYLAAARALEGRVVFCGRLEHEELAELLPACAAVVVPSTFPEAFGMVAAEAAACGALPVSAAHSGLAEVSAALAHALPEPAAQWLSFALGDGAVRALAANLTSWLLAEPRLRERARTALVASVRERWSWEGVARGVIAAAEGRLEELQSPGAVTALDADATSG